MLALSNGWAFLLSGQTKDVIISTAQRQEDGTQSKDSADSRTRAIACCSCLQGKDLDDPDGVGSVLRRGGVYQGCREGIAPTPLIGQHSTSNAHAQTIDKYVSGSLDKTLEVVLAACSRPTDCNYAYVVLY